MSCANAERSKARLEGGGLHAEQFGRTVGAVDSSAGMFNAVSRFCRSRRRRLGVGDDEAVLLPHMAVVLMSLYLLFTRGLMPPSRYVKR
jgi:hypothetical protein